MDRMHEELKELVSQAANGDGRLTAAVDILDEVWNRVSPGNEEGVINSQCPFGNQ